MRAVAALLVFGYHIGHHVIPHDLLAGGYSGVAFFFVLSGFVLTWGTDPSRSVRRFYVRRFARIWPCHFVVWLAVLVLPITSGPKGPVHATLNLLLLHAWSLRLSDVFSVNGVAWSLSCEMFFYLLFPFVFAATLRASVRTQWTVVLTAFVAASAVIVAGSLAPPNGGFALFVGADPLIRFPEFLLGVVAARSLQSGYRITRPIFVIPLIWAVTGAAFEHGSPTISTWLAPVYLLIISAVAQRAIDGRRLLSQPWFVYAGKVSFAFYLVHQLVLNQLFKSEGAGVGQAALALALAAALAVALHHIVELPAHRFIVVRMTAQKVTASSDPAAE